MLLPHPVEGPVGDIYCLGGFGLPLGGLVLPVCDHVVKLGDSILLLGAMAV